MNTHRAIVVIAACVLSGFFLNAGDFGAALSGALIVMACSADVIARAVLADKKR